MASFVSGCASAHGRARAMHGKPGLKTEGAIPGGSEGIASMNTGCWGEISVGSRPAGEAYRGSWAAQRVVARFATKRMKKATRITTTPPTVRRSQRSELSRASNSCFPVMTNVLMSSFTGTRNDCSDQDHKLVFGTSAPKGARTMNRHRQGCTRERRFA